MKIVSKEQENAQWRATLQAGTLGGIAGLGIGTLGVVAASRRYHAFAKFSLPLKAFIITASGMFSGVIAADHGSRGYESSENPADVALAKRTEEQRQSEAASQSPLERVMAFGRRERYKIVGASWVASMVGAFTIVNRDKYLTGQQKLVQARVYAQGLTLAVLIASAAFELSDRNKERGRWEEVEYTDEKDHKKHKKMVEKEARHGDGEEQKSDLDSSWKNMVKQEEERLAERDREIKAIEDRDRKNRQKAKKDNPEKAKKDVSKAVNKGKKEDEQRKKEETGGDDEVELVEPVKGKKGEGKLMRKVSDQPNPNSGTGVM